MSNSLFGDCDPGYATWQAISSKSLIKSGNTNALDFRMKVDLMSLTPIAKDRPTLWLFLSVAMGWIAKADIGTERLRYTSFKANLTLDGWVMLALVWVWPGNSCW